MLKLQFKIASAMGTVYRRGVLLFFFHTKSHLQVSQLVWVLKEFFAVRISLLDIVLEAVKAVKKWILRC